MNMNITVYGIWCSDAPHGGGWLRDTAGMLFQTLSKACAEAQLEQLEQFNGHSPSVGVKAYPDDHVPASLCPEPFVRKLRESLNKSD